VRVAVVGATGAVGAAVVQALLVDPRKRVNAVIGIARRLPPAPTPDVEWHAVDLGGGDLGTHLRGVDALVNAARTRSTAPSGDRRDEAALARRVLETAVAADVHHVVQLSSFLAYSPPADPGTAVEETWPTEGLNPSPPAQAAAALERTVDEFARQHEVVRLVRIRSGVVLGPRVHRQLLARTGPFAGLVRLIEHAPILPGLAGTGVPAVHHDDLAAAVRSSVTDPAFGAYNVAFDEPLRLADVSAALGARTITVPAGLVRRGAALADRVLDRWPRVDGGAASGWMDILAEAPRLDTRRARAGLEWTPRHALDEALRETLSTP
jgi:UDP-glucose 4-epimerase